MSPREGWALARQAVKAWNDDYAPSMGAALAYYTLFSIAPLLLIVIALAGFAFGDEAARGQIFEQLAELIGPQGAQAVEALVRNVDRPGAGALAMITGTVTLLLGASAVFGELQNALDRIWRAPARKHDQGWLSLVRTRVLSFGMILAVAFVLMVSLAASAALAALGRWWALDFAASFAVTTLMFALIYKIIPRVRIRWRDVWLGAAVTAALFALGKLLIGLYLGRSSVASVFGAAGSLVAMMVWVYYSAQIFLLGAEFTKLESGHAAQQRAHPHHPRRQPDSSRAALAVHPRQAGRAALRPGGVPEMPE
jgi:membrane protein